MVSGLLETNNFIALEQLDVIKIYLQLVSILIAVINDLA